MFNRRGGFHHRAVKGRLMNSIARLSIAVGLLRPPAGAALIAMLPLLSGCIGLAIETPSAVEVRDPVPLMAKQIIGDTRDRWACQPVPLSMAAATKDDYRASWGAPARTVATPKGETWVYEEGGRWCGVWIFALVPLPLLLPVCQTSDAVDFEGEIAVRSASRRMDAFGAGLMFNPHAMLPLPFLFRPARANEDRPAPALLAGDARQSSHLACGAR
jgi:hypothetical protein